ncbi:MAG: ATP-binding protein [Chthoniobacteraceae bacterium]
MHEGSIKIRITPKVKEIERLTRLVRQFGELHEIPSRALYSINLALDEMVTNVVLHSVAGTSAHPGVDISIKTESQQLVATVTDSGQEFDPLQVPAPDLNAPLAERKVGGLGIHLVRSLMDAVEYAREGDKNVLTLRKRIR